MKLYQKTLIILTIVVITMWSYDIWDNRNYLIKGDIKIYKLEIGESLTLKMNSNGSTGYVNCWLNEANCDNIKRTNTNYKRGMNSILGYDGSGGDSYWEYTAVKVGSDTVKIHFCPVGPENKTCEDFSKEVSKANYQIVFQVSE